MMFSTKDNDNDRYEGNCAATDGNGWWFKKCHNSNLNGIYYKKEISTAAGMTWYNWKNASKWVSLKSSKMMIKPKWVMSKEILWINDNYFAFSVLSL